MAKKSQPKQTKTKIEFLKSPTGEFKLGYCAGDKAELETKQAETLIGLKFAKKV